jgi:predicted Zn-dependent protease with MMP-like domain
VARQSLRGVLPDKITIYRSPLHRLYGADPDLLRKQIHHLVLDEVARHFGISDQRPLDLGRYQREQRLALAHKGFIRRT